MTFVAFVVLRVFCFRDLNLEEREENTGQTWTIQTLHVKKAGLGGRI
jgi:hypothetical protein